MVAGSTARAAPAASATATKAENVSDFSMISPLQALGLQRGDALGEDLFRDALISFRRPTIARQGH
jgi:hypothetical protein